jgi:phage-related protein
MHNDVMKAVIWMGRSKEDLVDFPNESRREAGYQLERVQRGEEPKDWKPMGMVGAGVREIRIHESSGAFRVIYLATRPEGVYVLHCFQKKTQKTGRHDLELAVSRFKAIPSNARR